MCKNVSMQILVLSQKSCNPKTKKFYSFKYADFSPESKKFEHHWAEESLQSLPTP